MKIKTLLAALFVATIPMMGFAQDNKSNAELSEQYKQEIKVIKQEIKLLKEKKKLDPTNSSYVSDLVEKNAELKTVQSRKKIVDTAIKADKAHKKAIEKAEKAKAKAEKSAAVAEKMKKDALKKAK